MCTLDCLWEHGQLIFISSDTIIIILMLMMMMMMELTGLWGTTGPNAKHISC